MNKFTQILLVAGVFFAPVVVRACGCDDGPPPIVHFKDGLTPNGPVCGCGCSTGDPSAYSNDFFAFADYGSSHAAPPPAPYVPPKRPNS